MISLFQTNYPSFIKSVSKYHEVNDIFASFHSYKKLKISIMII